MKIVTIVQFGVIQVRYEYAGQHPKKNVDWYSCYIPMIDAYFSATIDTMESKAKAFVKMYNEFNETNVLMAE